MKRTQQEIDQAIARIKGERPYVPNYNAFGDNNHELIDASIEALEGKWNYKTNLEDIADEKGWDENVIIHLQEAVNFIEGHGNVEDLLWYPDKVYAVEEKKVKLCGPKTCVDCPFSKNSMRGFLADYKTQDFIDFMNLEASFPCHNSMETEGKSLTEVAKDIEDGKKPFCRGYVESIIKSGKMPYKNKKLMEAIGIVKKDGLSENTMSIFEFINFHDQTKILDSLKH